MPDLVEAGGVGKGMPDLVEAGPDLVLLDDDILREVQEALHAGHIRGQHAACIVPLWCSTTGPRAGDWGAGEGGQVVVGVDAGGSCGGAGGGMVPGRL